MSRIAGPLNLQVAGNMLSAGTFVMRKGLLALSLSKPRQNAEEIFKTCSAFVYGDITITLLINFAKMC
jgi:hypothetical protein